MVESLSQARANIDRLKSRLANVKEASKLAAKTGIASLCVVGGGVAAGVIQAKYPTLPGSTVPSAAAAGALLITAAMSGMLDEHGDNVALIGAGMLAAIAAREAEKALAA